MFGLLEIPQLKKPLELIAVTLGLLLTGCGDSQPQFSGNSVYALRLGIEVGEELPSEGLKEIELGLRQVFGTPDSPTLPASLKTEVVALDQLKRAAGPVYSDEQDTHFGLYRKHCVRCHGVSGDGRGPAAKLLAPYPRDFRLGKFKFKSTPIGTKPTKHDLARLLRTGIPGTSMPGFGLLKEEDINALVDYVIYLSVRGETERSLLSEVAYQSGEAARIWEFSADAQRLRDELSAPDTVQTEQRQTYIEKIAQNVFHQWDIPQPDPPQPPKNYPIWGHSSLRSQLDESALQESISRGAQLFKGKLASCSQCHGVRGDGLTFSEITDDPFVRPPMDYDDWTKDWTVSAGISPDDDESLREFLRAGALKPVAISPRNLQLGAFRGGSSPQEVYLRIVYGIEGTPMPAAATQPDVPFGLTEAQVWDLVNFCLSLGNDR